MIVAKGVSLIKNFLHRPTNRSKTKQQQATIKKARKRKGGRSLGPGKIRAVVERNFLGHLDVVILRKT